MIKKTVNYKDFDDNPVTETLRFHITEAELVEMEVNEPGALVAKLERVTTGNGKDILDTFKYLIMVSYCEVVKDRNGRQLLMKKDADGHLLAEDFVQSLAYNALFTDLIENPEKASDFINGLFPKDLIEKASKEAEKAKTSELPSGNT
jgi:hypothetical protein